MPFLDRLSRLTPDLASTLACFPIPTAISVLVCLYANLDAAGVATDGWSSNNPVYHAGGAAFFAAGAADYFATGRNWSRWQAVLLSFLAAMVAAAAAYFTGITHIAPQYLFPALILLLMIAGFLRESVTQAAIWFFNLRLGLAALLAIVVGVVFGLGLAAIVESLRFLFELDIPSRTYDHIAATALALIGPLYGLSLAPRNLSDEIDVADKDAGLLERGVLILINYVLLPIVIIYALILHAYAVKIALDRSLPEGQIGAMVTIFALGGTAAWLLAWPWREKGPRLLRWFMRGWFWLTIVPAVLLVMAIWRRVSDYGLTPERYGLVLVAIWLIAVAVYLAIRRNQADMRAILGGFALLLLVGSVGPWGANGLSISSQFGRLMETLDDNNLLTAEQKIVEPIPELQDQAKRDIYSIVQALNEMGGLSRLGPLFAGRKDDPFSSGEMGSLLVIKIADVLKVNQWPPSPTYVSLSANQPLVRDIAGPGKLIGPIRALQKFAATPQDDLTAIIDGPTLVIKAGGQSWTVSVQTVLEKVKAGIAAQGPQQPAIAIEIDQNTVMMVNEAYGNLGDRPVLNGATFWLILRQ